MDAKWKAIDPEQIGENPFRLIGQDWMLLTAGTLDAFNTMTASWGGMGVLWDRRVCFAFVRPTRYTFEFVERHPVFTLSFFGEEHRSALAFCGAHSGREVNKIEKTGLTPLALDSGAVGFEQARLIVECRKLYFQDIDPAHFLDASPAEFYGLNDYHRQYIGEIVSCWAR